MASPPRQWIPCLLGLACLVVLIGLLPARVAAQQPSAVLVDAEQVVYDDVARTIEATGNVRLRYRGIRLAADAVSFDLQRELLTARGHVVLIDARGRELRGDVLTYDIRLELAEMRQAETLVDRVYIQGAEVRAAPRLITVLNAQLTTCDPARPAYRVTARQIEITPGERLVARQASLWLGRYRVLTLPVFVMSLRSPQETARSFPRIGYNRVDGFWVEYAQGYRLGSVPGMFTLKYGTLSGFYLRNALTYVRSPYQIALTVGRNQTADLVIFDQAELLVSRALVRVGSLPLYLGGHASAGLYRESDRGVETSRLLYGLDLRLDDIRLGPKTTWENQASWEDAYYGTGARQGVLRIDSIVTHELDPRTTLRLKYRLVDVRGGTPFAFDAISSPPHDLTLQLTRADRSPSLTTSFSAAVTYDFRGQAVAVGASYGRRVPERYHWGLGLTYNITTGETSVSTSSGFALGRRTYFSFDATYNISAQRYEEGEALITSRLCDCLDLSLRYRWAHQNVDVNEIWFEIGVSAFPESRLQFQYSRP